MTYRFNVCVINSKLKLSIILVTTATGKINTHLPMQPWSSCTWGIVGPSFICNVIAVAIIICYLLFAIHIGSLAY